MSVVIAYSTLCETDAGAYSEYLQSVKDGIGAGCAVVTVVRDGDRSQLVRGSEGAVASVVCGGASVGRFFGSAQLSLEGVRCAGPIGAVASSDAGATGDGDPSSVGSQEVECDVGGSAGGRVNDDDRQVCEDFGGSESMCSGRVMEAYNAQMGKFGPNGGVSYGRGKNYERNSAARIRRKENKRRGFSGAVPVDAGLKSHAPAKVVGQFSECSNDVRLQLAESRAKMLIAENGLKEVKAKAAINRQRMVQESRVYETKFELERQGIEEKLRKISEKRLGNAYVSGGGYATTLLSSNLSGAPSLSSGSVSPNSSASLYEWNLVKREIERLEKENALLKADGSGSASLVGDLESENARLRLRNQKCEADLQRFERREALETKGFYDSSEVVDDGFGFY